MNTRNRVCVWGGGRIAPESESDITLVIISDKHPQRSIFLLCGAGLNSYVFLSISSSFLNVLSPFLLFFFSVTYSCLSPLCTPPTISLPKSKSCYRKYAVRAVLCCCCCIIMVVSGSLERILPNNMESTILSECINLFA